MKTLNNYQLEITRELRAEMEEEAIEEDYEKMKDMLNELRAEEYEAIENARAEEQEKKEREEREFFELLNEKRRMSAEELIELNSKNTEKGEF